MYVHATPIERRRNVCRTGVAGLARLQEIRRGTERSDRSYLEAARDRGIVDRPTGRWAGAGRSRRRRLVSGVHEEEAAKPCARSSEPTVVLPVKLTHYS